MIPKAIQNELVNMTTEELRHLNQVVVSLIKSKQRVDASVKKASLRVGDRVSWTGRKGYKEGTLKKINRTKCIIVVDGDYGGEWNVPISMLNVIEKEPSFNPTTGEWE